MINTDRKIRKIRDKLSRIGIRENNLTDADVLATYSINPCGNLCPVPRAP